MAASNINTFSGNREWFAFNSGTVQFRVHTRTCHTVADTDDKRSRSCDRYAVQLNSNASIMLVQMDPLDVHRAPSEM